MVKMKIPDLKVGDEKGVRDNGVADLETAIRLTGFGKFHLYLIAIGGFSFLCSGLEYGLHAYTLPYAQCDLKIGTPEMGIINALFLAGSIVCSLVCGAVADTIGRKKVVTTALILGGISTLVASWSPNYIMFALVRFVSGFMSGAPGCVLFSYVGEFCSDKYRSRGICTIGFCWTLAWLILPIASWLIIPSPLAFDTPFIKYNTWRVFVALMGGTPSLLTGFAIIYFLTETPKFLFVQGQEIDSIEILKLMYHKNTGNPPEEYPVKKLVANFNSMVEENLTKIPENKVESKKKLKEILMMMGSQFKQIFHHPYWKKTFLISTIYFSNFFGYYGLGLWLPELFNRFQAYYAQHSNETVTICELSYYKNLTTSANSSLEEIPLSEILETCEERSVNLAVFSTTFIIGAACCVGNFLAIFLTNKVGGRLLSVGSMLIAGVSTVVVYFSRSEIQIVLVNCLFMAGVGTAMITIGSCTINIFPTSIRAAGVCIGILFGRLGAITSNLIFGLLLDISCEVPFFLLGGTIILGAFLCLLLPKDSQTAVE